MEFVSENESLIFKRETAVILLTKLDKQKILVLIDNIKYVEATPDTLVRFINGDMLIVTETLNEVADLVFQFKSKCLHHSISQPASIGNLAAGDCGTWT